MTLEGPFGPTAGMANVLGEEKREKILAKGATRDWREVMREATGEDIGPRAMLAYFQPLVADLEKRNLGLDCSR